MSRAILALSRPRSRSPVARTKPPAGRSATAATTRARSAATRKPRRSCRRPWARTPGPPTASTRASPCSDAALSTLKTHAVTELRAAGATWTDSDSEATVVAVLATPGWVPPLAESWVEEWYGGGEGGAEDRQRRDEPTDDGGGRRGFPSSTLNDLSLQTIVTWQDAGLTHVVIVASDVAPLKERAAHDAKVAAAVEAAVAGRSDPARSLAPNASPKAERLPRDPVLTSAA